MNSGEWNPTDELYELVSGYCDHQLTNQQAARLTQLLRRDANARAFLVEYVQLHGQLAWEGTALHSAAAGADDRGQAGPPAKSSTTRRHKEVSPMSPPVRSAFRRPSGIQVALSLISLAAVLLVGFVFQNGAGEPGIVSTNKQDENGMVATTEPAQGGSATGHQDPFATVGPLKLNPPQQNQPASGNFGVAGPDESEEGASNATQVASNVEVPERDDDIISRIDEYLRKELDDNHALPSPVADDQEWVRRAFLTFTGRIPTLAESREFLSHSESQRRSKLIESLTMDERTAENLSVNWLNLLIGRSNPRQVNENALYSFLKQQFQSNQPWINTVGQLVAAEGRSDQNGATNFLLAHLNDQATPATAVTARLFLGEQVHCTQCHNHPFAKELTQDQFWSLNAFFKQAERKPVVLAEGQIAAVSEWELVDREQGGMTFYETRRGQQIAVLPEFAGVRLPKDDNVRRRAELAVLLEKDPEHRVARSMVNRMWQHFFGYGFTMPVDDMGPHNPVSHPELLDFLTKAFVESGYDLRRLMYWIASTDAWQRSSTRVAGTEDIPENGELPLFSRVYPRHLDPEEVYDSIRVAIRSVSGQPLESSVGTEHRREWVKQFVESYGTDENDERLGFDGNIPQALMMMNGQDLEVAIPAAVRTLLRSYEGRTPSPSETLERVSVAALSRRPSENEVRVFRSRFRSLNQTMAAEDALQTALEDMFWAYLNSTEFSAIH
ncbi:MAG: DUF1553 domain-containing protein [Planctomyces sp.]|nr:DUF1553 domain-containing protein [Planctomyces sp.]